MSSSSSRAVSMMIGTVLDARSRLQTSSPSSFGSIRSSTTRSTCSRANRVERLLAVARLDHAEAVALERVREELLDGVLVVDEQDGGGVGHRQRLPAHVGLRAYYSHGWRRSRPVYARRRPRRGSLERPVNGRLYRGTWLLVGAPAAHRCLQRARAPSRCRRRSDRCRRRSTRRRGCRARGRARRASTRTACRAPPARWAPAAWLRRAARALRAEAPQTDRFARGDPRDAACERSRTSRDRRRDARPTTIVVMAHRDNNGAGPGRERQRLGHRGADRARARVRHARRRARRASARRTRSSSSRPTAARSAASARSASPSTHRGAGRRGRSTSTAIAGRGPPRLVIAGDRAAARRRRRSSRPRRSACSSRPADGRARAERPRPADRPRLPVHASTSRGRSSARGIPAVTMTTGGERPPAAFADRPTRLDRERARRSSAARRRQLLGSLDSGRSSSLRGPRATSTSARASLPRLGDRARADRRAAAVSASPPSISSRAAGGGSIPLAPALRSYRSRARLLALDRRRCSSCFALAGVWPGGAPRSPLPPSATPATHWPVLGLIGARRPRALGWLVARARLVPRRPRLADGGARRARPPRCSRSAVRRPARRRDQPVRADLPASLAARVAVAAAAPRPAARRPRRALWPPACSGRCSSLGSFAIRYGLGLDAPWYLRSSTASGYVKLPALVIASRWLAGGRQVDRARHRPLRALPERPRAAAPRAGPRGSPAHRAYSEVSERRAAGRRAEGVGSVT